MNKRIVVIICEGKGAATEKNFLKGFYNDKKNFLKLNRVKNTNLFKDEWPIITFHCINYMKLQRSLDARIEASKIIVYVDNDIPNEASAVKKVVENFNKYAGQEIILALPSEELPFEELISFYFKDPRKIISRDNKINKYKRLKKEFGENYKSDKQIYGKVILKGSTLNLLNNFNKFKQRTKLQPLVFWKDIFEEN